MRGYLPALLIWTAFTSAAFAAAAPETDRNNPFDLSAQTSKLKDAGGLPTVAGVAELEKAAQELFDAGNCAQAIPALERYGRQANYLANLVADGLQPYYGASYDDKKNIRVDINTLVVFEGDSNKYKEKRNKALFMQAECYRRTGDNQKAVAMYSQVLHLLNLKEGELWASARSGLYTILGYK